MQWAQRRIWPSGVPAGLRGIGSVGVHASKLFEAVACGDAEAVRSAIESEPSLAAARDERGLSALITALYRRQPAVVVVLLAADPPLDLFEGAALGRLDVVARRLDEGAPARSPDGFTALHLACFFGHAKAAHLLLERGADAEAIAPHAGHVRPLHSAAASRNVDVVRVLVEHGVDVNAQQDGGHTALDAATLHELTEMAELLRAHGATE